MEGMNFHKLY